MTPIYTAFYTVGTIYEQEANRLRKSLDRLSLEHDIRGVADRGLWKKNAAMKAEHIDAVLADYPNRAVVQIDADAVVWKRPTLFETIDCDVALHRRRGIEWLGGTIYFAPTSAARCVARRYLELIHGDPTCSNEQTKLGQAIEELAGTFKLELLPASMCWIHDAMAGDLGEGEEPIIEQLQCSRVAHQSALLPNRLKRLKEIESL